MGYKRMWRYLVCSLAFTILFALAGAGPASAVSVTTSILGDMGSRPRISGQYITWQSYSGYPDKQQIALYDRAASAATVISNGSYENYNPEISGDNVVWSFDDGDYNEVAFFNGSTLTELTDNDTWDLYPRVSGDNIAWHNYDGNDSEVVFFDGSTVTTITNNDEFDGNVSMSGDKVVWEHDDPDNDYEIILYDHSEGSVTTLTANVERDRDPEISGNKVVWEAYNGSDYETMYYDGSVTTTLSTSTYNDRDQQIDGDVVVWTAYDSEYIEDPEIMMYDGSTVTTVTDNNLWEGDADVSGGLVVWRQWDEFYAGMSIHLFDGSEITTVAAGLDLGDHPQIDGNAIVWADLRGDVYMAEIGNTPGGAEAAPVIVASGDVSVTFEDVTLGGDTVISESSTAAAPPAGFAVLGTQYEIASTATYVGPITVTIAYDEFAVTGDEADLRMFHHNGTVWEDVTVSVDTAANTITGQTTSLSPFIVAEAVSTGIEGTLEINSNTLNLKSKGNYMTAYIELPAGYSAADINIGSIRLNGTVPAQASPTAIGDHDGDGIADLMVKFDRAAVQAAVGTGAAVGMTVTGSLAGGTAFTAGDAIKVIDQGKEHFDNANVASVVY